MDCHYQQHFLSDDFFFASVVVGHTAFWPYETKANGGNSSVFYNFLLQKVVTKAFMEFWPIFQLFSIISH